MIVKNPKHEGLNTTIVSAALHTNFKGNLIPCKYLYYNKNHQTKFDETLNEQVRYTYRFSNNDFNKFMLLLTEGAYPYKYKDNWEKHNETSLPEKEQFYCFLNVEDIIDSDYTQAKK